MRNLVIPIVAMILLGGCAKERPQKLVPEDALRLDKSIFNGEFIQATTVIAGSPEIGLTAPGETNFENHLVRFEFTRDSLDVYLVEDVRQGEHVTQDPLMSFPAEHVDLLFRKNEEDRETHEQIESSNERPWNERRYAKIDFSGGTIVHDGTELNIYERLGIIEPQRGFGGEQPEILTTSDGYIQFDLRKSYKMRNRERILLLSSIEHPHRSPSEFSVVIRCAFKKYAPNVGFRPKTYSKEMQKRFGLFKTVIKGRDDYDTRVEEDLANVWDKRKPIVYYFSKDFPASLKPVVQEVFTTWNDVFKRPDVAGRPLLEIRENTGEQEMGDLRFNMINWIPDAMDSGLLGYGPSVADPRTGEIVNASVNLYGSTFRRAIEDEKQRLENKERQQREERERHNSESGNARGNQGESPSRNISRGEDILRWGEEELTPTEFVLRDLTALRIMTHPERLFEGDPVALELQKFRFERNKSTGCAYPAMGMIEAGLFNRYPDEELIPQMVKAVLYHELGHNLGLRHNFKASADARNKTSDEAPFSSTMDYGAYISRVVPPGKYDIAALKFAYSNQVSPTETYLYGTDEDQKFDPYANVWDEGTTATDIVQNLIQHYNEMYYWWNFKGRKIHFGNSASDLNRYLNKLFDNFWPIRLMLEENMSLRIYGKDLNGKEVPEDEKEARLADLDTAVEKGVLFFLNLGLERRRSHNDITDERGELLVRGIWLDKALAMSMIGDRITGLDPLDTDLRVNYFDHPKYQVEMIEILSGLLADPTVQPSIRLDAALFFMFDIPENILFSRPMAGGMNPREIGFFSRLQRREIMGDHMNVPRGFTIAHFGDFALQAPTFFPPVRVEGEERLIQTPMARLLEDFTYTEKALTLRHIIEENEAVTTPQRENFHQFLSDLRNNIGELVENIRRLSAEDRDRLVQLLVEALPRMNEYLYMNVSVSSGAISRNLLQNQLQIAKDGSVRNNELIRLIIMLSQSHEEIADDAHALAERRHFLLRLEELQNLRNLGLRVGRN